MSKVESAVRKKPDPPKLSNSDKDLVRSSPAALQPLVQVKDDKITLNKEPEKSKILEEKRAKNKSAKSSAKVSPKRAKHSAGAGKTIGSSDDELQPLMNTEAMNDKQKSKRPHTRTGGENARSPKKFLIKKKKRRLQSGFKNPKKWDERFYLSNGEFVANDPISQLYNRSKSNRLLSGKSKCNILV